MNCPVNQHVGVSANPTRPAKSPLRCARGSVFTTRMRLLVLAILSHSAAVAAPPPELTAALETFRSDPPRGWSFTQTTRAEGKSTVERYDAAKPEFDRWSLVKKDDRAPTPLE